MGITDKKLKDKRFRINERAIIKAFFSNKKILGARVIARRAKISRSTLYRHHKTVYEIIPDYEKYILDKYYRLIGKLIKKRDVDTKTLYIYMLIFMMKNKEIFKMVLSRGNMKTIEKMIKKIESRVAIEYRLPKNCEKMLDVYRKEVLGIVEKWIKNDFTDDYTGVLSDILYLTKTLRNRLIVITK